MAEECNAEKMDIERMKDWGDAVATCSAKPEGMSKTLCQLSVFAEQHPTMASIMADAACSAIKTGMKYPSLMRMSSKFL